MAQGHAMMRTGGRADFAQGQPLEAVLQGLVTRLEEDYRRRVEHRRPVEERWIQDIRQYEGRDKERVLQRLTSEGKSTATINVTRSKCNVFESKLYDMLFPTDDRNWGLLPTPVPEMAREEQALLGDIEQLRGAAEIEPDDAAAEGMRQQADALAQKYRQLEMQRQEAEQRADLMRDEIEDNLVECEYAAHCRDMIHDATVCGTGIIKGPIPLSERLRKNWIRDDAGVYRLRHKEQNEDRFVLQHTSFWHLFPDAAARSFATVESWIERHVMRFRDLQELAKQPGVDEDAIRELLREGPRETLPDYLLELDALAHEEGRGLSDFQRKHWVMLEYRGPLEPEELQAMIDWLIGRGFGEARSIEVDPLLQVDAVIWFCQGRPIKFAINHMADNSSIYSVFQVERSLARLWGVGIPYLMRSQQDVIYDAWRRMLDNAAFGAFPLLEINTQVLQPNDEGEFRVYPGMTLERNANSGNEPGIIAHQIPIHQEHYAAIIQLAMEFIDSETNISVLAAGEQGAASRTAGGMALLMNSVNVVFRRVTRNYDDGISSTVISRCYYHLMRYSQKEEIKGDYAVQARGSSVLLVREVQAQNLLLLATQLSLHPRLGRHIKERNLVKRIIQSMMLSSDDMLLTEAEVEAADAAEAEAMENAPPDPKLVQLQLQRELAMMDADNQMRLAELRMESELMKLVAQGQMKQREAQARLAQVREQNAAKERIFAGEAAIEGRRDAQGITRGSGGML